MKRLFSTALFVVTVFLSLPSYSAVLLFDGSGQLTGANGVDVDGTLYDVTFVDDSCANIFDGCVDSSFDFMTSASATTATGALLNQVFSPPSGYIGSVINILGCDNSALCSLYTPFDEIRASGDFADALQLLILGDPSTTTIGEQSIAKDDDYSTISQGVLVDWELSGASAVPIPASIWFFASAVLGLVGLTRAN